MKVERKWLPWIVIGAATAIRLAYFFQYAGTPFYNVPMWDADEYHTMAVEFTHGRLHPYLAYRPPVYPILLAIVYLLFGVGPFAISMLQIAGGVLSAVLAQKIAGRLFGAWAGLAAGLATALSGMMFYNDLELMPTGLETLLLLLLVWELVKMGVIPTKVGIQSSQLNTDARLDSHLRGNDAADLDSHLAGNGRAWLAGLWFALGALTRAVLLPLFPVFLWWLWKRKVGVRKLVEFTALALGPIALSLVIHLAAGVGPSSVAAQGGINFYIGSRRGADGFTATFPGVGAGWSWETVRRMAESEAGKPLTPTEADQHYWKKGRAEIAADPGAWVKLTVKKALLFWNHLEISNNRDLYYQARRYPIFGAMMWLSILPALPLALAGAWLWRRRWDVVLLAITIALYYATVVPFFVNARFRSPLLPLLFILAAGGAWGLAGMVRRRSGRSGRERVGAGVMLAIGLAIPWLSNSGINPKRWDYGLFTEATALERSGQTKEAKQLYKEALQVNPRAPFVNYNLGEIERHSGHAEEAVDYYRRELEIQPAYGTAWSSLGAALTMMGDDEQALYCYKQAFKLRPDLVEAGTKAVEILLRKSSSAASAGQMQRARDLAREATTIFPNDLRAQEWEKRISEEK